MGTRGLFGFTYKGRYYVAYNHWDSYPSGLGVDIVNQIRKAIEENRLEEWKTLLEQIRVIDWEVKPTEEEIEKLAPYTDLTVSNGSTSDWYCLIRKTQGNLNSMLKCGYIDNHVNRETGLPECEEYAYILNFDTNMLDFYTGTILTQSYSLDQLPDFSSED